MIVGATIPLGGITAHVERIQPMWLETEFRHSVIAFGGGGARKRDLAALAFRYDCPLARAVAASAKPPAEILGTPLIRFHGLYYRSARAEGWNTHSIPCHAWSKLHPRLPCRPIFILV
jgi:ZIP family zinc transporter